MDLSKLPKLSQTPAPPPQDQTPGPAGPDAPPRPAPSGLELFCQCGAPINPGTNFCSNCGASYHEALGGRGGRAAAPLADTGGLWMEAFLSIAVGLFLMFMAPTGIKYLTATVTGKPFTPYLHPTEPNVYVDFERFIDPATQVTTDYKYTDRFDRYWSDMAITWFAIALIAEGIVLAFVRNRWVVLASAVLVVGVTVLNLWYVFASYTRVSPITRTTYGLPLMSVIAIIFGVVMAGYQFRLFADLNATASGRR